VRAQERTSHLILLPLVLGPPLGRLGRFVALWGEEEELAGQRGGYRRGQGAAFRLGSWFWSAAGSSANSTGVLVI